MMQPITLLDHDPPVRTRSARIHAADAIDTTFVPDPAHAALFAAEPEAPPRDDAWLDPPKRPAPSGRPAAGFWRYVVRSGPDDCWGWSGYTQHGSPRFGHRQGCYFLCEHMCPR